MRTWEREQFEIKSLTESSLGRHLRFLLLLLLLLSLLFRRSKRSLQPSAQVMFCSYGAPIAHNLHDDAP